MGNDWIRIEADDLQLALSLRHACRAQSAENTEPIIFWRVVRERCAPQSGPEFSVFSSGKLKTFLHGTGTLLVKDIERREVVGFIGATLPLRQLTEKLLPLVMRSDAEPRERFTNK